MRQVFLERVLVKSVRGVSLRDIMDVKLIDSYSTSKDNIIVWIYFTTLQLTSYSIFPFFLKSLLVQSKFFNFVFPFRKIEKEINKGNPAPALLNTFSTV